MHNTLLPENLTEVSNSLTTMISPKAPVYASLLLEDGTQFEGRSFGFEGPAAGEVVFSTGMVGYPEALTDASYSGQILVMTYPIMGNYGVANRSWWEDDKIHINSLIVSNYIDTPSHSQSIMNLGDWLYQSRIPALEIKDTRLLTQHIRTHGTMLGKIVFDTDIPFHDPNTENLVAKVSTPHVLQDGSGDKTIVLIDCGAKHNIVRCLRARNVRVITVPWDWDLFSPYNDFSFDGIVISNGPGNPKMPVKTIQTLRTAIERRVPTLGYLPGPPVAGAGRWRRYISASNSAIVARISPVFCKAPNAALLRRKIMASPSVLSHQILNPGLSM